MNIRGLIVFLACVAAASESSWCNAEEIPAAQIMLRDARGGEFTSHVDGIEVTSQTKVLADHNEITGIVKNSGSGDRCIDLKLSLPIDCTGWRFGLSPQEERVIKAAIPGEEHGGCATYPIVPVSSEKVGLTIAIPPDAVTRFSTGVDETGPYIIFRIGLSADSKAPNQTSFRAVAFRHDGQWGFRSALSKYYTLFKSPFFERRVKRIGAWTSQTASHRRNPELCAYHEAGFPTWRTPGGTESGVNVELTTKKLDEGPICSSLEEFEKLCELEADEKAGVYSLPYTIVGQKQIMQLDDLPKDYDAAMKVLEKWSTTQPILFNGPPQASSFRSSDDLKAMIRSSALHDEQHRLTYVARPYRGATLTFPANPNPNLFRDTDALTVGKYELDYYLPLMLGSKFVDGVYIDSLGRWCGFNNFRHEHFKYSTMPLTYAGSPAQPCIWNLQSHAEYLAELSKRLHAQGKIVLANGVHPDRLMLGAFLDVMGCEGTPTYDDKSFYALRVAAGMKPYCYLNATGRSSPKLWASCLYMGYLLNSGSEKGAPQMAKYLPTIIRLNEAGWEPVTKATAEPAAVGVERWGANLFTVMNRSKDSVDAVVRIEGSGAAEQMLSGKPLPSETADGNVSVHVKLAAEEAMAIEVKR